MERDELVLKVARAIECADNDYIWDANSSGDAWSAALAEAALAAIEKPHNGPPDGESCGQCGQAVGRHGASMYGPVCVPTTPEGNPISIAEARARLTDAEFGQAAHAGHTFCDLRLGCVQGGETR